MNRTDSLKVINAFITELGASPKAAAPAPAPKPAIKAEPLSAPDLRPVANPPQSSGLGQLMAGCAGFEIGVVSPEATPPPVQEGLGALIQGCAGFDIGHAAEKPDREPVTVEPVKPATPAEPSPTAEEPVMEVTPEAAAARKALASVSNKPLLLSLLQYYASESQRPNPSRSMLKTTKEQVMKHWPQLTLTPLISALDGMAS